MGPAYALYSGVKAGLERRITRTGQNNASNGVEWVSCGRPLSGTLRSGTRYTAELISVAKCVTFS